MSLPRPVVAGQTSLVTRRCAQRQFLLQPSAAVNNMLGYCLAVAADRHGIQLHGFCFMANHVHLVQTDARGQLPEFCRWLFEFTAKCHESLATNCSRRRARHWRPLSMSPELAVAPLWRRFADYEIGSPAPHSARSAFRSKALNAHWGRWENLWSAGRP